MKIEEKTYQKITPGVEENYLTTFHDGDDIQTYEGVKTMYCPASFDTSSVREISPKEHLQYQTERGNALKQEIENNAGA